MGWCINHQEIKNEEKVYLTDKYNCYINLKNGDVIRNNECIKTLSGKPFGVLKCLIINNAWRLSSSTIFENVWDNESDIDERKAVTDAKAELVKIDELRECIDKNRNGMLIRLPKQDDAHIVSQNIDVGSLKDIESEIIRYIWSNYTSLKLRDEYADSVRGTQVCDLYVFPEFEYAYSEDRNCILREGYTNRIKISAPSGYGKTSLIKAMLLGLTYNAALKLDENNKYGFSLYDDRVKKYEELCNKVFNGSDIFPVYINAEMINDNKDLNKVQSIVSKVMDINEEDFTNLIKKYNSFGKLLLLIDAYDEIENKKNFKKMLNNFIHSAISNDVHIVVTSRPINDNDSIWDDFEEVKIKPLYDSSYVDNDRIIDIVEKFLTNRSYSDQDNVHDIARYLIQYYQTNEYLCKLMYSPYTILRLVIKTDYVYSDSVFKVSTDTNVFIEDLVNALTDRYYEGNSDFMLNNDEISPEVMRVLLENIAYKMLCENDYFLDVSQDELAEIFEEASKSILKLKQYQNNMKFQVIKNVNWRYVANVMSIKSGILIPEKKGYVFQTDTIIMPFLAALWIKEIAKSRLLEDDVRDFNEHNVLKNGSLSWDCLELIHSSYKYEVLIILLSVIVSNNSKGDIWVVYSASVIDYLLHKYEYTLCINEKCKIEIAIIRLLSNFFGKNYILNPMRKNLVDKKLLEYRRVVLKTLFNSSISIDSEFIAEKMEYIKKEYKFEIDELKEKKLIN